MIEFCNLTRTHISTVSLERLYKRIFSKNEFEVSVVFMGDARMRQLNKKHRGKDKVANVLSFLLDGGSSDVRMTRSRRQRGAGEIFLHVHEKDIEHLFVHGCLHLLGYDHIDDKDASRMEKKERDILKR